VADALARAAKRGVDCRVLADSVGSHTWFRNRSDYLSDRGVRMQAALPVGVLRRRASRLDLRNHRKIVVIDGQTAWTGSQNILNPVQDGGRKFCDMMVRLQGPIVLEIQHVFRGDWYFETNELLEANDLYSAPEECGDVCVQALPSGPNYPIESYQRLVVDTLHGARKRAIMTAPYFVPDEALLQAMQVAALRGVEMTLIVPLTSDHLLVDAAGHAYFDFLLSAGVNIYQHTAGLLHAKALTVDDSLALVGSANFDIRSFALNFELNMIFYGGSMARDVRELQETYIAGSEHITPESWSRRSTLRKAGQNIAKLFSPIL
jgi:cardiolipin synthase